MEEEKFRIKVVESNDGSKMYYPQVLVEMYERQEFWCIFYRYAYVYKWCYMCQNGNRTIHEYNLETGSGSSVLADAKAYIDKYIADAKKQKEDIAISAQKAFDKMVKATYYIEPYKTT